LVVLHSPDNALNYSTILVEGSDYFWNRTFIGADLNNDGAPDYLHTNVATEDFSNPTPSIEYSVRSNFYETVDFEIASWSIEESNVENGTSTAPLGYGDLNGDGFTDILFWADGLGYMLGDGAGDFLDLEWIVLPQHVFPTIYSPNNFMRSIEYTGDGLDDVVVFVEKE
jgi:hypothetical protein